MDSTPSSVLVLEEGQLAPDYSHPPRRPKLTDTLAYVSDPDRFCRVNFDRYGPVFKTSVFGGTTVFVGSAAANQMVFNGDGHYTEIALPATTMAMFGEHSLFQRPDLHRQRKGALTPAFTGKMLAGYLPQMHRVVAAHLQDWDLSSPLALMPAVESLSFDILAPLLLGIDLSQGDRGLTGLPITAKADLKALYKTFFDGFYGLVKSRSPLTAFGRGQRARAKLMEFMGAVIQQRRGAGPLDPSQDFLAMMLASQQQDPASVFSDPLIKNQALLQLWASHYEVMGLLSAWMYQLGGHPQWFERLRGEQTVVLADVHDPVTMGMAPLQGMTLLEATLKETLRTLPPSSTANRRLTRSVVVDGLLYEQGWGLIAEPRIAHIQEQYFRQPEQFDPDRFLPERGEGKPYEFIPFGGGVHACLGAQLALALAKVFGVHVLDRFDWQLQGEARFTQFPLRQLKDSYRIQLQQR